MDSLSSSSDELLNSNEIFEMYASTSSSSMLFDAHNSSANSSSDTLSSVSVKERKSRSSTTTYTNEDRNNSLFYKQYVLRGILENAEDESSIHNPSSWIGKKFCHRFSMPFELFQTIVSKMKQDGLFCTKLKNGQEGINPDLLILCCLRVLCSGCTFDAVEELSCIHEETI